MIYIENISKSFGKINAVNDVTLRMEDGSIFGLLGTNGAGKSTLLRMLGGIIRQEQGNIYYDGEPVYDNEAVKKRIFYLSDDQYYFPNATPEDMGNFYKNIYAEFDEESYYALLNTFHLEKERKLNTFSKGMKKQAGIFAAISSNTDFLLCDEVFDGLDPIAGKAVRELLLETVKHRNMTVVIASHNLGQLTGICGKVGVLYRGRVLISKDVEGDNLEEIFAEETEAVGYDIKSLIS